MRKFIVKEEIPSARDLHSFDYFDVIPVNTVLYLSEGIGIHLINGMVVCDFGSQWYHKYLEEVKN